MLVPPLQVISYAVIARECYSIVLIQMMKVRPSVIVILRTWALYGGKLWPVILLGSTYVMVLTVQAVSLAWPFLSMGIWSYILGHCST
jgi:hypothetical protein